jgi:PTS system fructose-specific IIC component
MHLTGADPILILAVVLVIGVAFGAVARRVKLPAVTGQILAGLLIGKVGFEVFDADSIAGLQPITHFALGLMAVSVGAHLNIRRLRNAGKRLFLLLLFESITIPTFVFLALSFFDDIDWSMALLFGALAISTAPATIIAIVKQDRAKGVFVKTLIAAVALNNLACIFLFELARLIAHASMGTSNLEFTVVFGGSLLQLAQAAGTGAIAAVVMALVTRLVRRPELVATAGFIAILLTVGLANYLGYSPLLACLFLGLTQTNVTHDRDQVVDTIFANFEPAILAVFFTLGGMELSLDHAGHVGLVAAAFFAARLAGKLAAGNVAMRLAGATAKLRKNLGMALTPQAGVAVGLVILLEDDPILQQSAGGMLEIFVAVVLTVVVANEIVGPVLTRLAVSRAGEMGHDRLRLIDFIQEQNIVTDLGADTIGEAIEDLTALLVRSHHIEASARESLLKSVLDREADMSTCLGGGLAVPHGILPEGSRMVGVMGISRKGLNFPTPDGRPVHCVVLLATPPKEQTRHLQILGMLARTVGSDAVIQTQLFNAQSPAHAYEILNNEEAEEFNYFLEDLG